MRTGAGGYLSCGRVTRGRPGPPGASPWNGRPRVWEFGDANVAEFCPVNSHRVASMPKRLMHFCGEESVLPVQPLLSRDLMTETVVYHARTEVFPLLLSLLGVTRGQGRDSPSPTQSGWTAKPTYVEEAPASK